MIIAVVRNGRVTEIVEARTGADVERPHDPNDSSARLCNITLRPDIKVGHVWGTEPEGYGTTYDVIDGKIVQRVPE